MGRVYGVMYPERRLVVLELYPPSVYSGFDFFLYILDSVKHFSGLGRYTDILKKYRIFILTSIGLVLYL